MAWIEDLNMNGMKFRVGALDGHGEHRFTLILSKSEIEAAGENIKDILDWFSMKGQEWGLVREWAAVGYDQEYFSYEDRIVISNSEFADADEKRLCFERPARPAPRVAERKPNPGYVYLVKNQDGNYKIGRSLNPNKRIESMGVKLPFPIEAVCIIPSEQMSRLEQELHARFDDKRLNGEWFALADEDVEYIRGLA